MGGDVRAIGPAREKRITDGHLKQLVSQGLSAMKAGSDVAAKATDEISDDASSPELKSAPEHGNQTSRTWAERIGRAVQAAGGGARRTTRC